MLTVTMLTPKGKEMLPEPIGAVIEPPATIVLLSVTKPGIKLLL
jgi:hypothetical protein